MDIINQVLMSTELSLFVLQTDTENVFFNKNVFIITDDISKAYKFFFETWDNQDFWDEDEEDDCHSSGREYRPYKDRTEEEKSIIHKSWYENRYHGVEVHQLSLEDIKGVNKLTDPLKTKITSLENQIEINALKESVKHLPPLPVEIFDLVIDSHLE